MKKCFNASAIISGLTAVLIAVFMNVSCEVGLGASVDTYPPSLSISYPSGDSLVIRDTFVMKGQSDDETSIANVTVNFKPTEASSAPAGFDKTYTANFEPRGKEWDCSINNKVAGVYEIPDGEYKVTVIATDSAARTTTVTRVYKIDNTAPLVVIKRPADNDSYGRTLKITGDISDENTLGTLTFTPYRKNGDVYEAVNDALGNAVSYTQNNISGNGLEVIVARYYEAPASEDEVKQNAFYRTMLNSSDKNAKEEIYYSVKVNDKAVSYKGGTPDETGNVSGVFYIYDDIYADIYSDSSSDGIHLGLTNKQLVQILNGNDTSTAAVQAKEKLAAKKYESNPGTNDDGKFTFSKAVKFSISPNSSPSFTVGGYEYKNEGSSQTSITNDGVMNITVTRGADQHSLKSDTIRVLIIPAKLDANNKLVEKEGETPIVLIEAPEVYNAQGYSGTKTAAQWNAVRTASMKNGDNITINIKTGTLVADEHYLVKVEGRDAENVDVEAEGGKQFGFLVSQNSQPPVVSIESSTAYDSTTSSYSTVIANNSDIPDAKIQVKGKVSVETKRASVSYKITVTDGSGTSNTPIKEFEGTVLAMPATGWATSEHDWTWQASAAEINAIKALDTAAAPSYTTGLYLVTVAFDAKSSSGLSTANSVTRTFYLDTTAPEVTDVVISPLVTYDEAIDSFVADREYVNGTITVKANVNDNHTVMETIYSIKAGEYVIQSGRLTGNIIKINDINTAAQASYDKKALTVEFTPVDKAGNKGAKVTKSVYIDQDTDKPVIKITNADKTVSASADVNKDKNLFDLTTNNKILGSVSDDDKLDSISVQWKKADAADSTYADLYGFPKNTSKSSEAITIQFINKADNKKLSEGIYKIKITGTDEHNATGSSEFYIAIDDKDPAFTITSKSDQFQTGSVTVNGTVQDSSNKITVTSPKNGVIGIYEVSAVTSNNATVTKKLTEAGAAVTLVKGSDFTVINSVVTINWSDTFACVAGGESLTYTAEDKYGKTTTAAYSYKEDQVAPSITITSPTAAVFLGSTLTSFQKFTGTASDSNSGIASVEYKFGVPAADTISLVNDKWTAVNTTKTDAWLSSGWQTANGTEAWNLNLDCSSGYADGSYVWFRAVDVAGNKTALADMKSVSVTIDSDVPSISFIKVTNGGQEVTAVSNVYYVKAAELKITGKVAETYVPVNAGGIQQCLSVDNTDGTLNTTATSTGLDFTYTIAAAKLAKGQKSLRFTAKDKATQNSSETITIFVDKEAPNVEISAITPQVSANAKDNNVNGIITVSGNASDDDKVSKTIFYINDVAATDSTGAVVSSFAGKVTKVSYSDGGTRFSYTIDTTKWDDKSALKFKFETTDRSGNVSVVNSYNAATEAAYNQKELYIDQSTDLPVLSSSNMNLAVTTAADISSSDGGNLYGMGSQTIYVTAGDDDGVKTFAYKIDAGAYQTLYTGASTSVTKSIAFPNTMTGAHTITFIVTDINNKSYTSQAVYFAIDNDVPVIAGIKIAGKTYEKAMFVPKDFEIIGTASDVSGISTVELTGVPAGTTCSGTTNWTSSEISESEGSKSVVVTAKDIYGRASTVTLEFKVDITAPVWKATAAGQDVPTTVKGGQKEKTNVQLNEMATPFWFNSDSITLSGNAYDANEIAGYTLAVNGGIPLTANGGSSYSIIASYSQGANTAVLKAKDTAGNETSRTININVDTIEPVLETPVVKVNGDSAATQYIKSGSTVVVEAAATDATSGISKILIGKTPSFAEADAIATIDLASTVPVNGKKSGSADISAVIQTLPEGTNSIYVRAKDVSGLSSIEKSVGGLVIDTTAPVITYTSHSDNEKVNKLITISGTYVELNKAASPNAKLYYKKASESSWTSASNTVTVNADGTWSVADFNTTSISDNTKYNFQLRMSDAAGNTVSDSASYLTLDINQNSDRPVIKLNFATDGNARLNSGIFAGTITDDDGDVKSLAIQAVPQGSSLEASKWINLTVSSGSWEIPEAKKLADGTYTLYFKVVDKNNTTFTTTGTDGLTVPYIQYSSNTPVPGPVSFSVDTTPPSISLVDVSLVSASTDAESYSEASVQNNKVLGGATYRYAKFKVNAADSVSKGSDLAVKVNVADTDYAATYNSSDKFYYTSQIDLSGIESGIYQLTVTATDQANMAKSFTKMVIVDNTAPDTIKNVTPSGSTEVTGDFTMSGLVQDDEDANSGLPSTGTAMWYYIPKYSERNATGAALESLSWSTENFTRSSVTWSLKLGDLADTIGYNPSNEKVSDDFKGYVVTDNTALYDIPVWFKVMDNAGNIGYIKDNVIHYNPNADKPTVAVTYPGESEKENGKIVMGGTARFQGSASDNEGIEGVYLQFDMDGNGTWENGEGITGVAKNASGKVYAGGDKDNVAVTIPVVGGKGFKAKGTLTWTSSIDLSGITLADGKTFNVRAIAIDSDTTGGQLASAWTNTVEITINNDIPQFDEMYLVQYKESSYTNFKQQIKYSEDVFICGSNWRLEGRAMHKEGILSVTVDNSNTVTTQADSKDMVFQIPVNPTGKTSGTWTSTITATDKGQTPHPKTYQVSVNIDNDAPAFADGSGELVLYKDAYGVEANKLGSSATIQNSNGSYASLSSRLTESGSGFAYAVFYFERDGASENRVYNVMKNCGADRTANKTVVSATKADGSVYINEDGLAVLYKATVGRSGTTSIELTTNDNIRTGGLVKIGGAYHKISGVTSSAVTLADEVDVKFTSGVEFVYGMVVDNSGESRKNDGSLKDDDGDGMVESYSKSGSNYTWDVEVPSANIPDGPIDVHVVLFDKAGNMRHSKVQTRLSNNAPRITSVKLGTDLNGNGSYSNDEYEKFYALASHSNASGVEIWNLDTKKEMGTAKNWTAKNNLSVVPEFVGGTAPFKYVFTTSGASTANLTAPVKTTATSKKKGDTTVASTDGVTGAVTMNAISITNAEIGTDGEGNDVTYQFSFWDSTEETTAGVDSSWTVLNATVRQLLSDGNMPSGYIRPFYWNSKDDNSLYQNSKDNGHIELEADWKNASGYNSGATSGQYDADPKVSGKIVLRGKIYDDVRLGSLAVTFADFGSVTVSSFSSGSWSSYTDSTGGKILAATVSTESIGQNGHVANYEIVVDTSKISGVAGADKAITLTVIDAKGNTFTSAAANGMTSDTVTATYYASASQVKEGKFYASVQNAKDEVSAITSITNPDMELNRIEEAEEGTGYYRYEKHSRTGYYKVDVVPYVTKISTSLDKAYSSNTSVFNRSAKGWYPVRQSESVTATGFNLKNGNTAPTVKVKGTASTPSASSVSSITFPIAASGASGALEVTVNSIVSLNNVNSNLAEYNKEANGVNNDTLDDDRQFKVWKITGVVTNDTTVRYPTFAVGKDTNQTVGFVYDKGADQVWYNLGGTGKRLDTSFTQWYDTACAVDSSGNLYGSSQNGDSGGSGNIETNLKYANYKLYAFANKLNGTNYNNSVGAYSQGGNSSALEWTYANSKFNAQRVLNPKIVTNGSNSTGIFTTYYDSSYERLVFRYGTATYNNTVTFASGVANRSSNTASATGYQIIAGTGCSGNNTIDGSSATNAALSGEYSAVGVSNTTNNGHTKGTAVVAWYDASNQRLLYSYNTAPTNTANAAQWGQHTKVIDSDFAGWYVDMAVDPDGGIHIAYYGASNGDLKYAYMPYYDSDATIVYVDSYLSVGTNISVDYESKTVTKPDGTTMTKYVPFISYYMSSFTKTKYSNKIAWITNVDASGLPLSGVELDASGNSLDKFTGNWETMIVPTTSIPLDYSVGVGIKKNGSDVNEPILGYGTKTGLETALLQ